MAETGGDITLPAMARSAAGWLMREGTRGGTLAALLDGLCRRLTDSAAAISHARLDVHALHPLVAESSFEWSRDSARVVEIPRFHIGLPFSDGPGLQPASPPDDDIRRVRLSRGMPAPAEPSIATLAEAGATDYLACPVVCGDGQRHRIAWATDAATGFGDADIEALTDLSAAIAGPLETLVTKQTAGVLLETYLGRRSGARVLAGEIHRGSGETINAVLWLSDLRGFTALSERLPSDQTIGLLNAHFERLVGPIKAFRGEVLKFIGDGLLAIFPIEDGDAGRAAQAALNAVRAARAGMAALAGERKAAGEPAPDFGVALTIGDVVYGNIGAPDRLDFTVIGPTVNAASRIEPLCKTLDCPVLASDGFAAAAGLAGQEMTSLGHHALRGIDAPAELFTLPEFAKPPSGA